MGKTVNLDNKCAGCAYAEPYPYYAESGALRNDCILCTHPKNEGKNGVYYRSRRSCRFFIKKGQPKPEKTTRTVYMKITNDEFELPIAIADSPKELADILGQTRNSVTSIFSHNRSDTSYHNKIYIEVEIEDD